MAGNNNSSSFRSVLWTMCIMLIISILVSIVSEQVIYGDNVVTYETLMTLQATMSVTLFMIPALLGTWIGEKKWVGSGLDWDVVVTPIIISIAMVMVSLPFIEWTTYLNETICSWSAFAERIQDDNGEQAKMLSKMIKMDTPLHIAITIAVIGILPAVCEEMLFRGVIFRGIFSYTRSEWTAIIISSVFFSTLHMETSAFLPRMTIGIILALLMSRTNSLVYPIIAHAANNIAVLMTMAGLEIPIEEALTAPTENPGPWMPIMSFLGIIALVKFTSIWMTAHRYIRLIKHKEDKEENVEEETPGKKDEGEEIQIEQPAPCEDKDEGITKG